MSRHARRRCIGAREVGFTVLSMSLSLIAVFIPILLMGGIVGRYFREFAVTLSVAILVSLVVSLTHDADDVLALLRPAQRAAATDGSTRGASAASRRCCAATSEASAGRWPWHRCMMLILLGHGRASTSICTSSSRKDFSRTQDTGRLIGFIQADQSISFQAMQQKLANFVDIVQADPAVDNVVGFTGGGAAQHRLDVRLAEAARRAQGVRRPGDRAPARQARATSPAQSLPATRAGHPRRRPAEPMRPTSTRCRRTTSTSCAPGSRRSAQRCRELPRLADVNTDQQDKGLQTSLVIDRDTAARLGVTPAADRHHAQRRVRPAPGLDDLHAAEPVSRGHGGGAGVLAVPDSLEHVYVMTHERRAGAAVGVRALRADQHAARRESPVRSSSPSTISFNLPEGTSLGAGDGRHRRTRSRKSACRRRYAAASRERRSAFQDVAQQPAVADPRRAARRLHRARHPLRELRASDHDPVDAAVGRRRRAAGAAAVPDRVQRHRADRRDPADRHREEERDHDDRLRARRRAQPRQAARATRSSRPACCASARS